jgi:osmoprotectant transport system ATP-binding protein
VIALEGVTKVFADTDGPAVHALRGVDLRIECGETVCLIGASGCGKTTILRMMNRLAQPTGGRVLVDGEDVSRVDPIRLRRRMGYVIQSGGLFPHMTVEQNIGLLCRLEGWDAGRTRTRVHGLLDLVHLPAADYADRFPAQLSGGECQRVGVARALALDPEFVLLDEPFGALDPVTRAKLQAEFLDLRRTLGKTMVFVSHDLDEAFLLADRVAYISSGEVIQVGTRAQFENEPATPEVARFVAGLAHA